MEVNFNPSLNANPGATQPVSRQTNQQPTDTTMSIGRTQALEQTLQTMPTVRPDAVARASALVADENYPSADTLDKLAGLLANQLSAGELE